MKPTKAFLGILTFALGLAVRVQAQFTYTTNNGAITITGYTGPGGAVTIPGTIDGLPVTSIGYEAFYSGANPYRDILTSVIIPDSVTNIGVYAFAWDGRLTEVTLGNGLRSIDVGAFALCGLATITIPNRVSYIGDNAFAYCGNLSGAYFRGNAPALGSGVFQQDNNIVYYVPGTLGWGPTFGGRPTAPWNSPLPWLYTIDNEGITITRYIGPGGDVIIPDTISGLPVTHLGYEAFWHCTSVTGVTIPNTVTTIGEDAFDNCSSLESINVPDSVTNIGTGAFEYCSSLASINLPDNVLSIGQFAFEGCTSLTSFTFPSGLTRISAWTFDHCSSLTSVTIPDTVTSIDAWAFQYCNRFTNVIIGVGVTNINGRPFGYCPSLTAMTVVPGNSVFSSRDGILYDTNQATLIQCPEGKFGSYTIPAGVISIGLEAFTSCRGISNVTIPDSVTSIGDQAFYSCTSLAAVFFQGNAPSLGGSLVFFGNNNASAYYLPGATGWGSTFGGLPTALWNPQVPIIDPSFGVGTNGFGFTITGTANIPVLIEACTNLASGMWDSLQSATLTNGSFYFNEPDWTNYRSRFYRIRWP